MALTLEEEQAAFDAQLPQLLASHRGEFALVKNGVVVEHYRSHEKAYEAGLDRFGLDEVFLIGEVTDRPPEAVSISWASGVSFG